MGDQSQKRVGHISPNNLKTLQHLLEKKFNGKPLTEQEQDVLSKIEAILGE